MTKYERLIGSERDLLAYLRSSFPMYHQSNFFFRDIQTGVADLLRSKGVHVRADQAETIARSYVERLEKARLFVAIDRQTWAVNVPEFRTPQVAKPAAKAPVPLAKPVVAATAAS